MFFSPSFVPRVLTLLAVGLSVVATLPLEERDHRDGEYRSCRRPRVRKEWRDLSPWERKDYLRAVDCLHHLPGQYQDIIPALSNFEDYVYIHKIKTPYVHLVGHFLPWHRYFLWVYETDLRTKCGYHGAQPYWDYTLDVPPLSFTPLSSSPIWSPHTGFGGNGKPTNETLPTELGLPRGTGGGCISDGPFKSWTIHIGQNTSLARDDRCLQRSLNPVIAREWLNRGVEEEIMRQRDYASMSHVLEGEPGREALGIHGGGHFVIGGSGGEVYTANAEPLFYLHHANLDRIWREWQLVNPEERLYDISGPIAPWVDVLGADYTTLSKGNVTLDYEIDLGRLGEPIMVGDVMDSRGGFLCYVYE